MCVFAMLRFGDGLRVEGVDMVGDGGSLGEGEEVLDFDFIGGVGIRVCGVGRC